MAKMKIDLISLENYKSMVIQKIQNLDVYQTNITNLLNLEKKKRYDNEKKIAIANYKGTDIYITEFLFAKNRGMIEDLSGHSEIESSYFKLLPFVFMNRFDELYQNLDNHRFIYSLFDGDCRRIFHILDEQNNLISMYVISQNRFERQINKKFKFISNLSGRAVVSSILNPAGPFWRQIDLIEELYQYFLKNTLTQERFISLVDEILEAKKQNPKSDTTKLEKEIEDLVYELYDLSDEEILIIERQK